MIGRRTCLWVVCLLSAPTLVSASEEDLRLINAAATQDKVAVRALLNEGVNVNVARADGVTAFLYAVHWDDFETVDLLLQASAYVNAADDHGVTALARACENASVSMVEKLLRAGANANTAETSSGLTPLMTAVRTGNLEVVSALLAYGANVNAATTKTRNVPLMWAVAGQRVDIARKLIEERADVHASTAKGLTPLMMAARNGDVEMARTLLAAGVGVNETGSDGMHVLPFSIVLGQADFAHFLLAQGADPNGEVAGIRALHAATGEVGPWLAEWRQKHGAAVRGKRLTPAQRPPLVEALIDRGADPNTRITNSGVDMSYLATPRRGAFQTYSCGTGDLRGVTPLWIAARDANTSDDEDTSVGLLRTLLAAGADYNLRTDDGTTVLMAAAGLGICTKDYTLQRGNRSPSAEGAVSLLLDAGADVKAVNEADFTALHGAAFRGLNEVIQILVERGANINARDFRSRTPYRLAQGSKQSFYFQGYPETTAFIERLGADTGIGLPGTVQERQRDVPAEGSVAQQEELQD